MDRNQGKISETDSADGQPAITRQDILDARAQTQFIQLIKHTLIAVMFITAFVLANRFILAMQNPAVRYMGSAIVALSSLNAVGDLINFILFKIEAVNNRKK